MHNLTDIRITKQSDGTISTTPWGNSKDKPVGINDSNIFARATCMQYPNSSNSYVLHVAGRAWGSLECEGKKWKLLLKGDTGSSLACEFFMCQPGGSDFVECTKKNKPVIVSYAFMNCIKILTESDISCEFWGYVMDQSASHSSFAEDKKNIH